MKPIVCPEEQVGECIDIKNGNRIVRVSIKKWWRSIYLCIQEYRMDEDTKEWTKCGGSFSFEIIDHDSPDSTDANYDLVHEVINAIIKVKDNYKESKNV
jgi:hypothetical protein